MADYSEITRNRIKDLVVDQPPTTKVFGRLGEMVVNQVERATQDDTGTITVGVITKAGLINSQTPGGMAQETVFVTKNVEPPITHWLVNTSIGIHVQVTEGGVQDHFDGRQPGRRMADVITTQGSAAAFEMFELVRDSMTIQES